MKKQKLTQIKDLYRESYISFSQNLGLAEVTGEFSRTGSRSNLGFADRAKENYDTKDETGCELEAETYDFDLFYN